MNENKATEIALHFMRDNSLHEKCCEPGNHHFCDLFHALNQLILKIVRPGEKRIAQLEKDKMRLLAFVRSIDGTNGRMKISPEQFKTMCDLLTMDDPRE